MTAVSTARGAFTVGGAAKAGQGGARVFLLFVFKQLKQG